MAKIKLSPEEREKVERGEVLTRLLHDQGVEAIGIVDAAPAKVYRVVTDYDHYREFIPSVVDAKVLEWDSKEVCILLEKIKIAFKTVEVTLRITHDRARHSTSWTKHGGSFARNDGSWRCEPHGKGKTLVTYTVDVEAGLIPQFVVNAVTRGNLPDLFEAVRKRVNSNGA
ncbi:MAG: SRPBCC family protein [Planctomycetes bacterium]|nr:SRPBCC family protein [Planctomycetota bacterium]